MKWAGLRRSAKEMQLAESGLLDDEGAAGPKETTVRAGAEVAARTRRRGA